MSTKDHLDPHGYRPLSPCDCYGRGKPRGFCTFRCACDCHNNPTIPFNAPPDPTATTVGGSPITSLTFKWEGSYDEITWMQLSPCPDCADKAEQILAWKSRAAQHEQEAAALRRQRDAAEARLRALTEAAQTVIKGRDIAGNPNHSVMVQAGHLQTLRAALTAPPPACPGCEAEKQAHLKTIDRLTPMVQEAADLRSKLVLAGETIALLREQVASYLFQDALSAPPPVCAKAERDCGDPRCEVHHAMCSKDTGECWHEVPAAPPDREALGRLARATYLEDSTPCADPGLVEHWSRAADAVRNAVLSGAWSAATVDEARAVWRAEVADLQRERDEARERIAALEQEQAKTLAEVRRALDGKGWAFMRAILFEIPGVVVEPTLPTNPAPPTGIDAARREMRAAWDELPNERPEAHRPMYEAVIVAKSARTAPAMLTALDRVEQAAKDAGCWYHEHENGGHETTLAQHVLRARRHLRMGQGEGGTPGAWTEGE